MRKSKKSWLVESLSSIELCDRETKSNGGQQVYCCPSFSE
ncbi:KxYKxGKxW signal peptide domain-containing protein [Algoriphagus sp. oki45]